MKMIGSKIIPKLTLRDFVIATTFSMCVGNSAAAFMIKLQLKIDSVANCNDQLCNWPITPEDHFPNIIIPALIGTRQTTVAVLQGFVLLSLS